MRRMKSSPIFMFMARREREIEPVRAISAGSGVVCAMVVEIRSSKSEVCLKRQ